MGDWSGGYVSDVEYVSGVYAEQGPSVMDLACIMAGYEPPRRPGSNAPFTYCDLGCGHAGTVSALAAANPAGRFWGIDLMPAHIARAEDFRKAAQIDNLTLIEADLAELAAAPDPGLPKFDYIALHGLFSWVSDPVRTGILRFLDRFLRPGGAVYVGYNVLPGWTDVIPTQKVLFEFAATRQGSSVERMEAAVGFLKSMKEAGARGLESHMSERLFSDVKVPDIRQRQFRYLTHEFLNAQWLPRFHVDVARELSEARLDYVASANLLENFAGIGLGPEARTLLETVPAGPLRETMEDFFNVRKFRRDVYVRGRREITSITRETMLADAALALRGPRPDPKQRNWPMLGMEFELDQTVYGPVFDRLEQGPATLGELTALVRQAGGEATANEIVGLLTGLELVVPVLQDVSGDGLAACFRHNRAVLHEAFRTVRMNDFHLATPVGHTAIPLSGIHCLMLDGMFAGVDPTVEAVSAHVIRRGEIDETRLQDADAPPGKDLPDPTADTAKAARSAQGASGSDNSAVTSDTAKPARQIPAGEIVRTIVAEALEHRVPLWRQLGLLPPARDG